jgi:hypothetical protein
VSDSLKRKSKCAGNIKSYPANGGQANMNGNVLPIPQMLNAMGAGHWELVVVVPAAPNVFEFVFKQPVPWRLIWKRKRHAVGGTQASLAWLDRLSARRANKHSSTVCEV